MTPDAYTEYEGLGHSHLKLKFRSIFNFAQVPLFLHVDYKLKGLRVGCGTWSIPFTYIVFLLIIIIISKLQTGWVAVSNSKITASQQSRKICKYYKIMTFSYKLSYAFHSQE